MVMTENKIDEEVHHCRRKAGLLLPRMLVEKSLEVERRRLHVLSLDFEAHGHIGSCPGLRTACIAGKSEKTK